MRSAFAKILILPETFVPQINILDNQPPSSSQDYYCSPTPINMQEVEFVSADSLQTAERQAPLTQTFEHLGDLMTGQPPHPVAYDHNRHLRYRLPPQKLARRA